MITELITNETFQISEKKMGWKEAIKQLAKPLIDSKAVEEKYVDAMISKVEEYGPFINLGKGIAIPHARPEDGVNRTAMRPAKPLIDSKAVEEKYVDAMISKVEEYGPFINLGKGIAIPHARPEDGVNRTAMGLMVLKYPIYLLDQADQEVTVLFMIAAADSESHLSALQELTIFLRDDKNVEKLKNVSGYKEFYQLFN